MDWMRKHKTRQVDYPMGVVSTEIVRKKLAVPTGTYGTAISADIWLEVVNENTTNLAVNKFWIAAQTL